MIILRNLKLNRRNADTIRLPTTLGAKTAFHGEPTEATAWLSAASESLRRSARALPLVVAQWPVYRGTCPDAADLPRIVLARVWGILRTAGNCWELLGTAGPPRQRTLSVCATCAVHRSHSRSQDLSARAIRIRDVVIRQHRTCIQQVLKITSVPPAFRISERCRAATASRRSPTFSAGTAFNTATLLFSAW